MYVAVTFNRDLPEEKKIGPENWPAELQELGETAPDVANYPGKTIMTLSQYCTYRNNHQSEWDCYYDTKLSNAKEDKRKIVVDSVKYGMEVYTKFRTYTLDSEVNLPLTEMLPIFCMLRLGLLDAASSSVSNLGPNVVLDAAYSGNDFSGTVKQWFIYLIEG